MHTEPPPSAALEAWLDANGTIEDRYGHLLLEQIKPIDKSLIDALRPYFESAHLDAREHFHKQVGIDLHPDAGAAGAHACYPDCLPAVARRGLFGEVVAGLVTQAYAEELVGEHQWSVPIFLFRFHADVESYLWDLRYDPSRKRQVFGRFGSDFVGVRLDAAGNVVRVIVGEAKWRASLTNSAVAALLHGEKNLKDPTTGKNVHNGRGIWF
ncbi:aminotransferase, partial [Sphingomonas melonis]